MAQDTPSPAEPTLFELPSRKAEDPPVLTPGAEPAAPPISSETTPALRPRRRWKPLRGGTPLERIEHFEAWLRGDVREEAPVPEGVAIYPPIYQLKITLQGIRPPVWRRVLVPGNVILARLHRIIQNVTGWWDYQPLCLHDQRP
jgi:hypothetical protein